MERNKNLAMGRISGSRNRDHELTRSRLVESLARQILMAGGTHPSLRVLAEGAGVDPGTLRHYFGDRRGVVQAAFEHLMKFGQERQAWAKSLAEQPARPAFHHLLEQISIAWTGALGGMHAAGFAEGMSDSELGQLSPPSSSPRSTPSKNCSSSSTRVASCRCRMRASPRSRCCHRC